MGKLLRSQTEQKWGGGSEDRKARVAGSSPASGWSAWPGHRRLTRRVQAPARAVSFNPPGFELLVRMSRRSSPQTVWCLTVKLGGSGWRCWRRGGSRAVRMGVTGRQWGQKGGFSLLKAGVEGVLQETVMGDPDAGGAVWRLRESSWDLLGSLVYKVKHEGRIENGLLVLSFKR